MAVTSFLLGIPTGCIKASEGPMDVVARTEEKEKVDLLGATRSLVERMEPPRLQCKAWDRSKWAGAQTAHRLDLMQTTCVVCLRTSYSGNSSNRNS